MLYGSNEARQTAKEEISRVYLKLANTRPNDDLTLDDIRSIMYYLQKMNNELSSEIRREKMKSKRNA